MTLIYIHNTLKTRDMPSKQKLSAVTNFKHQKQAVAIISISPEI